MKEHQKKRSINAIALILGISRERLTRALADSGTTTSQPMTVAAAFAALSGKREEDALRRRKLEAETDVMEMERTQKIGELVFAKDFSLCVADLTIEMRKVIQSRSQWDSHKLLVALSKVRVKNPFEKKS